MTAGKIASNCVGGSGTRRPNTPLHIGRLLSEADVIIQENATRRQVQVVEVCLCELKNFAIDMVKWALALLTVPCE